MISVSLEDLSLIPQTPPLPDVPKPVPRIDPLGRAYATGKRKNAVARVWIKQGTGKMQINKHDIQAYFERPVLRMLIVQPFNLTGRLGQFDIFATVFGGGLSGQAGALRHGISKALSYFEPELRAILKQNKMLKRDSRVKERKKPGQKGARAKFQFSKR